MTRWFLGAVTFAFLAVFASAQEPDAQLMQYIDTIKLVDNHAHVVAPDMEHDTNYDALRCETLPASPSTLAPANARFGPQIAGAWKALYGVAADSDSPENLKKVTAAQNAVHQKEGAGYFDWVLEQGGYSYVLANRVKMAPELGQHFKWVPYDDALLFPLDTTGLKKASPDRKILFEAEENLLNAYEMAAARKVVSSSLDVYLEKVIDATLNSQKNAGAVAIKFEVAYLRSLDFQPASRERAAKVLAQYAWCKSAPPESDYRVLQDFLFRYIAKKAGELGLAIHIHTGAGCGEFFDDRGSDPMLLTSVLNDPDLRRTNFVLLHGGSPFTGHNTSLIMKPNVFVDTSVLELLYSPAQMAHIMRPWLEMMPEHVIFGTDAGPFGPGYGWEETTYVASRNARRAVGIVLTEMMRDGVITQTRAKEIAERVLRKNALELYKLQ